MLFLKENTHLKCYAFYLHRTRVMSLSKMFLKFMGKSVKFANNKISLNLNI